MSSLLHKFGLGNEAPAAAKENQQRAVYGSNAAAVNNGYGVAPSRAGVRAPGTHESYSGAHNSAQVRTVEPMAQPMAQPVMNNNYGAAAAQPLQQQQGGMVRNVPTGPNNLNDVPAVGLATAAPMQQHGNFSSSGSQQQQVAHISTLQSEHLQQQKQALNHVPEPQVAPAAPVGHVIEQPAAAALPMRDQQRDVEAPRRMSASSRVPGYTGQPMQATQAAPVAGGPLLQQPLQREQLQQPLQREQLQQPQQPLQQQATTNAAAAPHSGAWHDESSILSSSVTRLLPTTAMPIDLLGNDVSEKLSRELLPTKNAEWMKELLVRMERSSLEVETAARAQQAAVSKEATEEVQQVIANQKLEQDALLAAAHRQAAELDAEFMQRKEQALKQLDAEKGQRLQRLQEQLQEQQNALASNAKKLVNDVADRAHQRKLAILQDAQRKQDALSRGVFNSNDSLIDGQRSNLHEIGPHGGSVIDRDGNSIGTPIIHEESAVPTKAALAPSVIKHNDMMGTPKRPIDSMERSENPASLRGTEPSSRISAGRI